MGSILLLVTVILMFVAVLVTGILLLIRFLRQRLTTSGEVEVRARFPAERIVLQDLFANSFGIESKGVFQIRGNGALVLTADQLWFRQAVTGDELSIRRDAIQDVSLVNSHLGKRYFGRRLLRVRFRTNDGEDAVAWALSDPEGWMRTLQQDP